MIYILFAFLSALFTSLTTIFAKIGIKNVNSNFATWFRTGIVILFSLLLCFLSGSIYQFNNLTVNNYVFLVLSGLATGCSWLCYYKALKLGDINKVAPIDKSSFILTSILFMIFFFDSTTKNGNVVTIIMLFVSIILMFIGTLLMIEKKDSNDSTSKKWLIYAILSAVFASLVSLFIKIGLKDTPTDLGTLIRTIIVFIFSSCIVLVKKDYKGAKSIDLKSWIFLILSSFATGGAWLFEYEALKQVDVNPVVVSSITKLAILLTMLFSYTILKEKFSKKSLFGLFLMVLGIVVIIIFGL
ncbi:drug/metabolite transporter [Firmicutes bacterium CAG:449]|nr:drug/metabolite transporter [Firmicutes bacterium CAG:449]